jgi:hypothetical protein
LIAIGKIIARSTELGSAENRRATRSEAALCRATCVSVPCPD